MRITYLIFCLLFATCIEAAGQVLDTLAVPDDTIENETPEPLIALSEVDSLEVGDTAKVKKERFLYRLFVKDYPNPNMALYLSLAIPGAGQLYNKRWWKLPFVYGAYAGLIASVDFNTKKYKLFRDAYISELKGEQHPFTGTRFRADDLRRIRDSYDKNRQVSYIGVVAVHLLQATEAFVDAHLRTFDISDDLSMRVAPGVQSSPELGLAMGVRFSMRLR